MVLSITRALCSQKNRMAAVKFAALQLANLIGRHICIFSIFRFPRRQSEAILTQITGGYSHDRHFAAA